MAIGFAGTHILDTFVAKNRNLNSFTPFNPHIFFNETSQDDQMYRRDDRLVCRVYARDGRQIWLS